MVATPARIGFIIEPFRKAKSETASVQTRHGSLARESEDPVETYFDDADDAQLVADARQAILSPERRLFTAKVVGLDEALALDYVSGTIPLAHYTDEERGADMTALTAEIAFDFGKQNAQFEVWG